MTGFHIIWAIAATTMVCCIAFYTAQANIEDSKQSAFMMKACVDAGGEWKKTSWGQMRDCLRPEKQN